MKNILLFIAAILSFAFMSCSSTYTIKDFSSREKFYDDFNNFASRKSLEVGLINGGTITVSNGFILGDTLYTPGYRIERKTGKAALADIKGIDYTGSDYKSANLLLKNGTKISVEEINVMNDTLSYTNSKKIITKDAVIPLTKIKKASYKNRWFSTPIGFLSGGIIGAYIGGQIPTYSSRINMATGKAESYQNITSSVIGLVSGVIIGTVTGWLIGYTYTYQFNP